MQRFPYDGDGESNFRLPTGKAVVTGEVTEVRAKADGADINHMVIDVDSVRVLQQPGSPLNDDGSLKVRLPASDLKVFRAGQQLAVFTSDFRGDVGAPYVHDLVTDAPLDKGATSWLEEFDATAEDVDSVLDCMADAYGIDGQRRRLDAMIQELTRLDIDQAASSFDQCVQLTQPS